MENKVDLSNEYKEYDFCYCFRNTNIVRLASQKLPAKDQKQIIRNRFAKCSDVLEFGQ